MLRDRECRSFWIESPKCNSAHTKILVFPATTLLLQHCYALSFVIKHFHFNLLLQILCREGAAIFIDGRRNRLAVTKNQSPKLICNYKRSSLTITTKVYVKIDNSLPFDWWSLSAVALRLGHNDILILCDKHGRLASRRFRCVILHRWPMHYLLQGAARKRVAVMSYFACTSPYTNEMAILGHPFLI